MRTRPITSPAPLPVTRDALQTPAHLVEHRRLAGEPEQGRIGVRDDGAQRLIDLVRDG